jgi:uncharacterized protein
MAPVVKPPLFCESAMHQHQKPQDHRVVVLGASPKPVRYSYQAVQMLAERGYQVIPVHPKAHRIELVPVVNSLRAVQGPVIP